MRNFILFLFIFNALFSYAQEVPLDIQVITIENFEPGKCYFSKLTDEKEAENQTLERPFILEVFPPLYEEVEVTLLLEDFKTQFEKHELIRHRMSTFSSKFIKKSSDTSEFGSKNNPDILTFCLVEYPSQWKAISKKDFENGEMTLIEKRLFVESKITKTYVNSKPADLTENQSFHKGGYWSEPKELYGSSSCGKRFTILDIKEKLVELDYDLELNKVFDDKTKQALIHFQRKNNLEEGNLTLKTLEMLGVEY